jgi:cardiolipin synthase
MQLRVEGSVVDILHEVFSEDWYFATGQDIPGLSAGAAAQGGEEMLVQVLRAGPDEEDHVMLRANSALVASARERLWISTGYFVPGETTQTSLQVAAAMGVDVRLLVSSKSQHPHLVSAGRSYYDALLRQGVRIFEYSQGIDHSKSMVIDRDWSTVGSSNLDERSLRLNFELSLLVHNPDLNRDLARIFEDVLEKAVEINREEFARRPLTQRLMESALRPFSPLL